MLIQVGTQETIGTEMFGQSIMFPVVLLDNFYGNYILTALRVTVCRCSTQYPACEVYKLQNSINP